MDSRKIKSGFTIHQWIPSRENFLRWKLSHTFISTACGESFLKNWMARISTRVKIPRVRITSRITEVQLTSFELSRRGNTIDSHRLIYFSGEQGLDKQHDLVEELFLGYFTQGKYIGDRWVLLFSYLFYDAVCSVFKAVSEWQIPTQHWHLWLDKITSMFPNYYLCLCVSISVSASYKKSGSWKMDGNLKDLADNFLLQEFSSWSCCQGWYRRGRRVS